MSLVKHACNFSSEDHAINVANTTVASVFFSISCINFSIEKMSPISCQTSILFSLKQRVARIEKVSRSER
uniref:Uncharacterized protein n=1 Tax=Nelumbo nucifera TaxID=4432 RepID=A0A822ZC75_NELNU|nr:TPA_asm: hypothetical protein HUJ06_000738 [Nelumbo nucifera]